MLYLLSNRQAKELLVRGVPLWLALPHPGGDRDWPSWARSVLAEEIQPRVASAELAKVFVQPKVAGDIDSLTHLLGEIHAAEREGDYRFQMEIVRVRLLPVRHIFQGNDKIQWPADVIVGGRRQIGSDK